MNYTHGMVSEEELGKRGEREGGGGREKEEKDGEEDGERER